jgi:hypothetical protein
MPPGINSPGLNGLVIMEDKGSGIYIINIFVVATFCR